jgi:PIN domain nuclease of toxin-antitoxin system
VILLDTHIWIWWVDDHPKLSCQNREIIQSQQDDGLGISIISCWEIAKLVEKNRLDLDISLEEWLDTAINYHQIQVLPLNVPIILESTRLSGFHADPADQIIVATARVHGVTLVTQDQKINDYFSQS